MIRPSAMALLALASSVPITATAREVSSLVHSQIPAGQKFEIQTEDRTYSGKLIDSSTGECVMQATEDGRASAPRTVYLLGSTQGQQAGLLLVKMQEVKVGMKMELGYADLDQDHRYVTSRVKAIRLD